jgi:hypothetical protein
MGWEDRRYPFPLSKDFLMLHRAWTRNAVTTEDELKALGLSEEEVVEMIDATTTDELSMLDVVLSARSEKHTRQQGRNEKCCCESGKKFKHCCM